MRGCLLIIDAEPQAVNLDLSAVTVVPGVLYVLEIGAELHVAADPDAVIRLKYLLKSVVEGSVPYEHADAALGEVVLV